MNLEKLDKLVKKLEEVGMLFAIEGIDQSRLIVRALYEVYDPVDDTEDTTFMADYVRSMYETAAGFIDMYLVELDTTRYSYEHELYGTVETHGAKYFAFSTLFDYLEEVIIGHIENEANIEQLSYDYITLYILRSKFTDYLSTFNN